MSRPTVVGHQQRRAAARAGRANGPDPRGSEPFRCSQAPTVGLLRRYSKKDDLTIATGRLAKLLEVERAPVLEPEPFQVRRVKWRLGEDGIRELIVDYEAGLAVPELQVKYGLSKGSVRKLLSEAGVSMRRRPVPEEVVEQVIELYGTGLSIREVAAKVGVPKTTVQNLLAKSGVAMRLAIRVPRGSVALDASPDSECSGQLVEVGFRADNCTNDDALPCAHCWCTTVELGERPPCFVREVGLMPGDLSAIRKELLVSQVLGRQEVGVEAPLLVRAEVRESTTIAKPDIPEVSVMVEIVMVREAWHYVQHDRPG